jgi:hypothetical protein
MLLTQKNITVNGNGHTQTLIVLLTHTLPVLLHTRLTKSTRNLDITPASTPRLHDTVTCVVPFTTLHEGVQWPSKVVVAAGIKVDVKVATVHICCPTAVSVSDTV